MLLDEETMYFSRKSLFRLEKNKALGKGYSSLPVPKGTQGQLERDFGQREPGGTA